MAKNKRSDNGEFYCSFCGKSQHEVKKLIAGPSVYICNECIELCNDIVRQELAEDLGEGEGHTGHLPTPRELVDYLDQYVIGQDYAKRVLSVAVYNHYKRLALAGRDDDVEIAKSNILLIGPTGSGKTLLAQTLARKLDVPLPSPTPPRSPRQATWVKTWRTSSPACFKPATRRRACPAGHRLHRRDRQDHAQVREPLHHPRRLRRRRAAGALEAHRRHGGFRAASRRRKHPNQDFIQLDTTNILFICGGAFEGLEKIVERRTEAAGIGFGATVASKKERKKSELLRQVEPDDLVRFGLIPEFVGRLPVIVPLEELDEEALMRIATEPKNALVKQYRKLFEMEGVALEFTPGAIRAIARKAIERRTGARGLRSIMEEVLLDLMFELPNLSSEGVHKILIEESTVTQGTPPLKLSGEEARVSGAN